MLMLFAILVILTLPIDSKPLEKPIINCNSLKDGNYALGCSGTFYQCTHTQLFNQYCYGNLKFNPEINACDEAAKVPICQSSNQTLLSIPIPANTPFSCKGRDLGTYQIEACSNGYVSCVQGYDEPLYQNCPYSLVYDAKAKKCQHKADILGCA